MAVSKRYKVVRDADGNPVLGRDGTPRKRVVGYQVAVSVRDPTSGIVVRKVVGSWTRRGDADRAEREAKIRVQNGTFELEPTTPVKPVTVADALAIWFDTKRGSITANSATGYESAIRLHLVPAFGDRDVTTLTHDDVQRQVNTWRDAGMGPRLLHRVHVILRAALARQVMNGRIPYNPADNIEKPSARTRKRFTIWSDAEIDRFVTAAEVDRLAPFWFLTLLEALRRGEALGLRWADLIWSADETACVAVVTQTVVPDLANGGAALIQSRAKTDGSRRSVQLTEPTIRVLKAHETQQKFERRALETRGHVWGDHDLICTTSIGTPITPSSIKRDLGALIGRAGLPDTTTHGLRHMAATVMVKAGVSPALVAAKLGHRDISTTARYTHLVVGDQAAANAAIEAAVNRGRASRTGTDHS